MKTVERQNFVGMCTGRTRIKNLGAGGRAAEHRY